MEEEFDYTADMQIDETALDVEWLEQPNLAMKYGKIYAKARKELTLAEENIKVIRAELIAKANDDPDTCLGAGVKPTGPNIEAYYRNHRKHKAAKDAWVEAQYNCNMAEIAKNEIGFTRKAALEALVTLHGQQYFAGPVFPRNLTKERQEREENKKQSNSSVKSRFTRQK
jgi:hypothetical protein